MVSVVIPTCFIRTEIKAAVESVLNQSLGDIEVLLVNDKPGHTASSLLDQGVLDDPRLHIVQREEFVPESSGAPVCRNLGIRISRGQFILFLDDDDILLPNCLLERHAVMSSNDQLGFCISQGVIFEDALSPTDPLWNSWIAGGDDLTAFLAGDVLWQTSGPLWRRTALEKVGFWDEELAGGQDYELHVRALAQGIAYSKCEKPDYAWRKARNDSISSFQSFKKQYRNGQRALSYFKAWNAVNRYGSWSAARKHAAWRTAVKLATTTLIWGGKRRLALKIIYQALDAKCVDRFRFLEAMIVFLVWGRIGSSVPSMWYLRWRRYV